MPQPRPLVVGMTGGIGSGKSTVTAMFAALGVPIIDTDVIARELVEPDQPCLHTIVERFGIEVLDEQGRLDRAKLRTRVFADSGERKALEAILHPAIREAVATRVSAVDEAYCIVVIPLLLESGQRDLVDRILVVDCPVETQIARASARDDVTRPEVEAIVQAQISRSERLAAADDVLNNDATLDALRQQVHALHTRYLTLAAAPRPTA